MNCRDYNLSLFCLILENLYNNFSCEGIKSRGWFITKYDSWICNQLYSNTHSLSFSSRASFDNMVSYQCFSAFFKPQILNNLIDSDFAIFVALVEFELSRKHQALLSSEGSKQDIILHHIDSIVTKVLLTHYIAVIDKDFALILDFSASFSYSITKHIE